MKKMNFLKMLFYVLVVGVGFSIYSCSETETEAKVETETGMITSHRDANEGSITAGELEFIGVQHNEVLAKVYDFLSENEEILQSPSIDNALKEVLLKEVEGMYPDARSEYLGAVMERQYSRMKNPRVEITDTEGLSRKEEEYLLQLGNFIDDVHLSDDRSFEKLTRKISDLERRIEADYSLQREQKILLFSATQTAKYSSVYWKRNFSNWRDLNTSIYGNDDDSPDVEEEDDTVKEIVKGDVAGAVGAAVETALVNLFPGAGQVAYGSAILVGAVGGSVSAGVGELIDRFW